MEPTRPDGREVTSVGAVHDDERQLHAEPRGHDLGIGPVDGDHPARPPGPATLQPGEDPPGRAAAAGPGWPRRRRCPGRRRRRRRPTSPAARARPGSPCRPSRDGDPPPGRRVDWPGAASGPSGRSRRAGRPPTSPAGVDPAGGFEMVVGRPLPGHSLPARTGHEGPPAALPHRRLRVPAARDRAIARRSRAGSGRPSDGRDRDADDPVAGRVHLLGRRDRARAGQGPSPCGPAGPGSDAIR